MNPTIERADSPYALPHSPITVRLYDRTAPHSTYRFKVYDEEGRFMGSAASQAAGKCKGWHRIVDTLDNVELLAEVPKSAEHRRIKFDLSERAAGLILNALFLAKKSDEIAPDKQQFFARAHEEVLRQSVEQGGVSIDLAFREDPI